MRQRFDLAGGDEPVRFGWVQAIRFRVNDVVQHITV